jgi:hypothetical protein
VSLDGLAQLTVLCLLGLLLILVAAPEARTDEPPPTTTVTVEVERKVEGHGVSWWAKRAKQNGKNMRARGKTIARLKRTLRSSPTVQEAIQLAALVYRVPLSTLNRRAFCESRLNPAASNGHAHGLFQFIWSTWRSTPFAGFSIWSPYANALAAGWMHAHNRGSEWTCR